MPHAKKAELDRTDPEQTGVVHEPGKSHPRYRVVLSPEQAEHYRSGGGWLNRTVFEVLTEQVRTRPDAEVFADARTRLTYAELADRVERCAAYLRGIGIGAGDVVTIQLPNRVEFPIVFFALELIGAVANTVNPDFRLAELRYILEFSGSSAFVCVREFRGFDYVAMARTLQAENPRLRHVVVAGGDADGMHDLDEGLRTTAPLPAAERAPADVDAVFRTAFTSGTTGDPKCVMHSFNTTLCAAAQLNDDMAVTEHDVQLVYLPVGLNWGYLCLLQTVLSGGRAVLMERFSARPALEAVARERVTYVATAPASIVAMLALDDLAAHDTSSLRVVITGGAAAAVETLQEFGRHFDARLVELYGMLETGFPSYTRLTDDPLQVAGTIGRVAGQVELRIVDASHRDVPHGQIGELATRGPSVCLGYHDNPEANARSFTPDGWFLTGDLARYVDDRGTIQITGRSKEIINRGGKKFFPREVEEILYTHPRVLHAALVGVPDARLGERNCLCVVSRDDDDIALSEVVAFLKGQVADYKLPEMVHRFDQLPMTATGKVRRPELVEQVQRIRTRHA